MFYVRCLLLRSTFAATAPRSAVAELGVVRRSPTIVPRITPAMTNSELNVTSGSSGYGSDALRRLLLLGFAHAGTLAAMRRVSPVPASFARRLLSSSVRAPVRLPRSFPPTPKPQFVLRPQSELHGPLLAAERSAASIFTRRSALTRPRSRKSQRTPNHALQRTAAAVTACAADRRHLSTHRHRPRQPPPSLSLGSLGVSASLP